MNQFAIEVENLFVEYRTKRKKLVNAVNGLSFNIQPGEVVGFIGPNGAGKSSTLRTLMGFQHPKSGNAAIFGYKCGSLEAKRKTSFLPEVALYYPFLTPFETLTLYGKLQGLQGKELSKQINALFEKVGLSAKAHILCKNLSKGMQQRVGIAQALLGNPLLLILDEVTSGLDPVGRRDLRALLQERQDQGVTIFFSSHELTEVETLCDRILLIDQGALVEEREMATLRSSLRKYTLLFTPFVAIEDLNARWSMNDGEVTALFDSKEDQLEAIRRVTKANGLVIDFGITDGSLEDYFIEKVGGKAA